MGGVKRAPSITPLTEVLRDILLTPHHSVQCNNEVFECLDCFHKSTLTVHGLCEQCGSSAVVRV